MLSTRGMGSLPDERMELYVSGGTYAFVTMLADPQPKRCVTDVGQAHCYGFTLSLFPHSNVVVSAPVRGRGDDHVTTASRPPNIVGRRLVAYLFTDGRATLRLRPLGYRARSSYVAAGRMRGGVHKLSQTCADPVCTTTPAASTGAGGRAFTFTRPAHLQTFTYALAPNYAADPTGGNRPFNVQSCVYPNVDSPDYSADPGRYPRGCDVVPGEPERVTTTISKNVSSTWFGIGAFQQWLIGDVTGRRYTGGFSSAAPAADGIYHGGYTVWFYYGVT
ncbi:MAG TPA: hypothetical protein VNA14_12365 [Mycobacteriales bacterium]|nr:hypothetical protein [Mycobacteriales bacterium]